jgi:hypothetical protein
MQFRQQLSAEKRDKAKAQQEYEVHKAKAQQEYEVLLQNEILLTSRCDTAEAALSALRASLPG